MRVPLTGMLLVLLAACGGPTWHGLTRRVADADRRLEAGDAVGAARRVRAVAADLDAWLESREGRSLRGDLDAGRVRVGRWTLAAFRTRILPRTRLWSMAPTDRLAAAFVAAGVQPEPLRAGALLAVALELARAGRPDDAVIALHAAGEAGAARDVPAFAPVLLPSLVELACVLDDDARLGDALGRVEGAAVRCMGEDALVRLRTEVAGALAGEGRCELVASQVEELHKALEARWREHDPHGAVVPEGAPFPWTAGLFDLLLATSARCRAAGDPDGALSLLDEAVPMAEAEGDDALKELGDAYIAGGLPGEAAALTGSVDDPITRVDLLVAAAAAWTPGGGLSAPVHADVVLWLEAATVTAAAARPREAARALFLEIAMRWEHLGDLERAAAARARASELNLLLDP